MAKLTDAEKQTIDELLAPIDAKVTQLRMLVQQGQRSQAAALATRIVQDAAGAAAVICIDVTDD